MPPLRCLALLWLSTACCLAQELPLPADAARLQREAGELIEGLPDLNAQPALPEARSATAPLTVERAQARLEEARRKQQRWEKLARQGVLSRAEAETCLIEVAQAVVRYEQARCARSQSEWENAQQHQADPAQVAAAAAALESSKTLAATAEAQFQRTQLQLAQVNLGRYRQLYAARLVSRSQLARAEASVAKLQARPAAP